MASRRVAAEGGVVPLVAVEVAVLEEEAVEEGELYLRAIFEVRSWLTSEERLSMILQSSMYWSAEVACAWASWEE